MKEIIRITLGLTIACLIAGLIMGGVFTATERAKEHNEYLDIRATMTGMLGFNAAHPAPANLRFYSLYRYIIDDKGNKSIGYVLPLRKEKKISYALVIIGLDGKFKGIFDLNISKDKVSKVEERKTALNAVLKPPTIFTYADSTIIAKTGPKLLAYLLPGEFSGFKSIIKVMLALNSKFTITGLEIMEDEEDPGLGAEISQDYFKNQFDDKSLQRIKTLKVVKQPLPADYRKYLEKSKWEKGEFTKAEIDKIRNKYKDHNICALTGATITSKAMTRGIKGMVTKFAYRIRILDNALKQDKAPVAF